MSKGNYLDEKCDNCFNKSNGGRLLYRFQEGESNGSKYKLTIKVCEICFPKVLAGGYWKSSL